MPFTKLVFSKKFLQFSYLYWEMALRINSWIIFWWNQFWWNNFSWWFKKYRANFLWWKFSKEIKSWKINWYYILIIHFFSDFCYHHEGVKFFFYFWVYLFPVKKYLWLISKEFTRFITLSEIFQVAMFLISSSAYIRPIWFLTDTWIVN